MYYLPNCVYQSHFICAFICCGQVSTGLILIGDDEIHLKIPCHRSLSASYTSSKCGEYEVLGYLPLNQPRLDKLLRLSIKGPPVQDSFPDSTT